jgi:hypothetical protein
MKVWEYESMGVLRNNHTNSFLTSGNRHPSTVHRHLFPKAQTRKSGKTALQLL